MIIPILLVALGCASVDPLLTDGSNSMTGPLHFDDGVHTPTSIYLDSNPLLYGGLTYLNMGYWIYPQYITTTYQSFTSNIAAYDEEHERTDLQFVMDYGFIDGEGNYFGSLFGLEYGLGEDNEPQGGVFIGPVHNNAPYAFTAGALRLTTDTYFFGAHDSRSPASDKPIACAADYIGQDNPDAMESKHCWFAGGLNGVKKTQDIVIADNSASASKASSATAPTSSVVRITCNDPDGCDYAPAHPTVTQSLDIKIVNVGEQAVTLKGTAGSVHINGGEDVALDQNDVATCLYTGADTTGVWACSF